MRAIYPLFALVFAASAPACAAEDIPLPNFNSVEFSGGGDVSIVPGPVQRVVLLSGSTQFTSFVVDRNGQLRIFACNERCPRNYPLHIRIEAPRVPNSAIRGGGTIAAAPGFGPKSRLSAAIQGGGTIDMRAVDASDVSAAVDGGGTISVRPRTLSAAVHGGGEVRYLGNPQVSIAVAGGGDVRREY
jgi:hypothetical protein